MVFQPCPVPAPLLTSRLLDWHFPPFKVSSRVTKWHGLVLYSTLLSLDCSGLSPVQSQHLCSVKDYLIPTLPSLYQQLCLLPTASEHRQWRTLQESFVCWCSGLPHSSHSPCSSRSQPMRTLALSLLNQSQWSPVVRLFVAKKDETQPTDFKSFEEFYHFNIVED